MADLPNHSPQEVRAGDTAQWRRTLPDYPASAGWQLTYALVGMAAVHAVHAEADGDAYQVKVPAAVTAGWAAGTYVVQEYVSRDEERRTICTAPLRVLPDLAAATGGTDTRTHARKVLDAIEAWLASKAPTAAAFEVAGRKVENYSLPDLLALRDRYRAEVRREERAPGRLLVRF